MAVAPESVFQKGFERLPTEVPNCPAKHASRYLSVAQRAALVNETLTRVGIACPCPRLRGLLKFVRPSVIVTCFAHGGGVTDVQFGRAVVLSGSGLVLFRHAPQLAGDIRSARKPGLPRAYSSKFNQVFIRPHSA